MRREGEGAQNSTTFAAFWNRWKQFRMLLRQRNGDSDNDCDGDGVRDGGGGGGDDDGECGERTYVCSFARLARSAGESRTMRAGEGGGTIA